MKEQKKKRKWWKISLLAVLILVIIAIICFLLSGGLVKLGRVAIDKTNIAEKVTKKIESGELPRTIELPQEVIDDLSSRESTPAPGSDKTEQQTAESLGTVDYSQGIDLSYATAIASVASGADIAAAYNAVLGCLSAADKRQIAAYLKNGQEGAAYSLVASRLTGDAYATLAGLYYKYLPMVQ